MSSYIFSQLDELEAEAIYVLRETFAQFENPCLLFSGGKDSIVVSHLAKKAFYPSKIPFTFLHVDTGHNFPETIDFRDKLVKELNVNLIVAYVQKSIDEGKVIEEKGQNPSRNRAQSVTLLDAVEYYKFDAAIGGARRDEEKARAKERFFSHRDDFGQWNPKNQRPELWNIFNGKKQIGEHFRVFPISNWTEMDVWNYILREKLELPSLYFSHEREVVIREDIILANSEFIKTFSSDVVKNEIVRFRTIGDLTITGAIRSSAKTLQEIINEVSLAKETERGNRADDQRSETYMEERKKKGIFKMKKIAVIGGGFAGSMLTTQLVLNSNNPLEINVFDENNLFPTGVAYNPYSRKNLLNVVSAKMSAFPNQQDDFLNWLKQQKNYYHIDLTILGCAFIPRYIYGEYLKARWRETLKIAQKKQIRIKTLPNKVNKIDLKEDSFNLKYSDNENIDCDICVLATGNHLPSNPNLNDLSYLDSEDYFQNPWDEKSVANLGNDLPILIIGNGLTMVDTVLCLEERKFNNTIFSLSPNGFNILPHRHIGLKYELDEQLIEHKKSLVEITLFILAEIKKYRKLGISAEPIIDALRPHTQKIWRNFNNIEKKLFLNRFRHLWGVARHRIPLHINDKIQELKLNQKLNVKSGYLLEIKSNDIGFEVSYFDKKSGLIDKILVQRIINCTGPNSDYYTIEKSFWKDLIEKGILQQDQFKLGINTNVETFETMNSKGLENKNLYALGTLLRGELWESTAVNELRKQAHSLSKIILSKSWT